jgi:hypothetical protein
MDRMDRMTPFNGWYKGDHGEARRDLIRATRTYLDANPPPELAAHARNFMYGVRHNNRDLDPQLRDALRSY